MNSEQLNSEQLRARITKEQKKNVQLIAWFTDKKRGVSDLVEEALAMIIAKYSKELEQAKQAKKQK